GQLRSTSLPLATSTVISGMPGATAISGLPSRATVATRDSRLYSCMEAPSQRTAATGAAAFLSVVYSARTEDLSRYI
ncbi:hypothetical protein IJG22_00155, partial [Candidatus Saccharibacteria bacterium]|nr:hypothetical protein [Candidatus Saccharibacteria bacterium]